jgi:hypothetical protein
LPENVIAAFNLAITVAIGRQAAALLAQCLPPKNVVARVDGAIAVVIAT